MPHLFPSVLAALCVPLALAACGESEAERGAVLQPDPAIVAALTEPIMTDPDLAGLNRGNAAIAIVQFDGVPGWTRDPDAIADARDEAVQLAGGPLLAAPEAETKTPIVPVRSARRFAEELPGTSADCLAALRRGFAWAADMPKAASLYPGSHVVESAGARIATCSLRTVRYVTAATRQDVLDFHYTLLSSAGYQIARAAGEDADMLTARKSGATARIVVGSDLEGMTEVTLATVV
jgi:hypothetical protein